MFIENTEELAQNKLLLLYLISKSDYKLTKKTITEFMLEKDYMNYFLVQQYLSELVESGFIRVTKLEKEFYSITDKGNIALSYFKDRILKEFKEDVEKKFIKTVKDKKEEREVFSQFYQKENQQFVVNLRLIESDDILFSIYLDVPNEEQAKKISDLWKNNTEYVYQNILNILITENNSSK